MDLDEMKTVWNDMSQKLENQQRLTDKLIIEMTQQKYKNRFSALTAYETSGAVICFAIAIVLLFSLNKMNEPYLLVCSLFCIAFLTILPILTLDAIRNMKQLDLTRDNYKNTLIAFTRKKKRMLLIQQVGMALGFLFFVCFIPVSNHLFGNDPLFEKEMDVSFYIAIVLGVAVMLVVSRWGYRSYKRVTASAERVIKELEA